MEIERLTVRLENVFLESGNLSTNYFVRLEKSWKRQKLWNRPAEGGKRVWDLLQEDSGD